MAPRHGRLHRQRDRTVSRGWSPLLSTDRTDRHGGHRPAPRERGRARGRPGAVHDRAAGEDVVWRSQQLEELAPPHRWRCLLMAGTSCSSPAPQSAYQIWLRPVATLAATPIPGTEGGAFPFWSPDSRFIGFFAAGKLKKVAIAGGPPVVLCDAPARARRELEPRQRDRVHAIESAAARPPARVERRRRADRRHDSRSGDRRNEPSVAALSARWPSLHLHRDRREPAVLPSKPAMIRIGSLDPAERHHHAVSGRVVGVICFRPCVVRPRRDADGAAVRSWTRVN